MLIQQLQMSGGVSHVSHRDKNRDSYVPPRCITLERQNLPLTIICGDKTYVLVLTRSNKLLLQKPIE